MNYIAFLQYFNKISYNGNSEYGHFLMVTRLHIFRTSADAWEKITPRRLDTEIN
jgi:hypothetical protein